jgi:phosphoribosyl 1,2-cyclic phosphodiesterase
MSVRFCVLGSGSEGNAALLMTPDFHVLIDAGFLPDEMAARLDGTGAAWETLDAVVLTHTHGDHIKKKCLTFCAKHEIHFICHQHHAEQLCGGRYFKRLQERGLVRTYDGGGPFTLPLPAQAPVISETKAEPQIRFFPIKVPHDCPPTFGFRIEVRAVSVPSENGANPSSECRWIKLGYLVDLGCCVDDISREVLDVDLLALEFNHDEKMQMTSGRHPNLIQRVMGKEGHLSNSQAADVFRRILEQGKNGGPKLLLQMHLSRDCNRAELAYRAAQEVVLLSGTQTQVFSTRQECRGTIHSLV